MNSKTKEAAVYVTELASLWQPWWDHWFVVHFCSLVIIFHGTNPAIYTQNLIRRKDTIMALRTTSGAALYNLKLFCLPCSSVLRFAWHDDKAQQKAALSILRKANPHPCLPTLRSVMRRLHSLPLPLSFKKDNSMSEAFWKKYCTLSLCFQVISSQVPYPFLFRWLRPPSFTKPHSVLSPLPSHISPSLHWPLAVATVPLVPLIELWWCENTESITVMVYCCAPLSIKIHFSLSFIQRFCYFSAQCCHRFTCFLQLAAQQKVGKEVSFQRRMATQIYGKSESLVS